MASQTPIAIQNENLPFARGKGNDGIKADVPKPAKLGRQDRKALRDLSKTGKPAPSGVSKASILKEKSTMRGHETTRSVLKSSSLTDEEIRRCHEWAKEGIEHAHFTGNDSQKLQKDKDEERVRKRVDKVMSALRQWTDMTHTFAIPLKEVVTDTENVTEMELIPEVVLPMRSSKSGHFKVEDLPFDLEHDDFLFEDRICELKLKEDHFSDVSCF